ncbi:MAG: hypothetical protein ACP5KN_06845 [Armatimonadota bacterium]
MTRAAAGGRSAVSSRPCIAVPPLAGLIATCLALAVVAPAAAASPYDLFFHTETDAAALGGADLPGEITGRPDLRRPTSLLESRAPRVRLDACSQTPLRLSNQSGVIGRWQSDSYRLELTHPLFEAQDRWVLGAAVTDVSDDIWYAREPQEYRLRSSQRRYALGLATELHAGWRVGATYSSGELAGSARGSDVAALLDLPRDSTDWPALRSDAEQVVLGVSGVSGAWEWGALRGWSRPSASLHVTRDIYSYSAPMGLDGRWVEGWVSMGDGPHRWYLLGREGGSSGEGSIMLGAAGRGDASFSTDERVLAVGWRQELGGRTRQAQIDWRESEFATYEQGYAGLLPGISDDVYTVRAGGRIGILSVRCGQRWPIADRWSCALAGTAHYAAVDADAVTKRVPGLGSQPVVEGERHIAGGRLRLWSIAMGLTYEDGDMTASLTGTAGYGEVSRHFREALESGGEPGEGPGNHLEPRPFITAAIEWRL